MLKSPSVLVLQGCLFPTYLPREPASVKNEYATLGGNSDFSGGHPLAYSGGEMVCSTAWQGFFDVEENSDFYKYTTG